MKIGLMENWGAFLFMELLLVCGMACEIMLAIYLKKVIREADNMSVTNMYQLKQFRLKYMQYLELHEGKPNSSAYIDKFISRLMFHKISVHQCQFISKQFIQASSLIAGICICKNIILGQELMHYLPFYVIVFLNHYVYFSICYLADVKNKKEVLRIELIDFLENRLQYRFDETKESIEELDRKESSNIRKKANEFAMNYYESKQKEWEELESLVKELII